MEVLLYGVCVILDTILHWLSPSNWRHPIRNWRHRWCSHWPWQWEYCEAEQAIANGADPCQPIGCDHGYHRYGCPYAIIDRGY